MREQFTDLTLKKEGLERLETIGEIIQEYLADGYKLTLRQLYYQLVSRDIIPNAQNEYDKLGVLLVKGRMAGMIDWSAIEDRVRVPDLPYYVGGVSDALTSLSDYYRLDRMEDQETYIEVWVEKDALSGVLKRKTHEYHLRLMVNRGYSSATAMYDAYNRIVQAENDGAKESVILYLGDHDPSGLDMVRDVEDRLNTFGVYPEIKHIALTMDQIEEYSPPPNPAKITDSRAEKYIEEHGAVSWEVDALPPNVLLEIIEDQIAEYIDMDKFLAQRTLEQEHIEYLKGIAADNEE